MHSGEDALVSLDAAPALLLASARLTLPINGIDRLRAAAARVDDWSAAVALARRHRVIPLLARHLATHAADLVPPAVLDDLRHARMDIAVRALDATRELARLLQAFCAAGIRVLPYKGPLFALAAYEDLGLRDFVDLDLVVAPRDFVRARAVLAALGYRSRYPMTRGQEAVIYAGQGHVSYVRDEGGTAPLPVELHWRFAALRLPWNPSVDTMLDRAGSVTVAGMSMPMLEPEDQLVLALLHGTRHQWDELEWMAGVAELVRRMSIDLDTVMARCAAVHGRRAALVGLEVARRVLEAPVPAALVAHAYADDAVDPLVRAAIVGVLSAGGPVPAHAAITPLRFLERCLDRARDRARLVTCSIVLPTPREWEAIRLPTVLTPLYVPIRLGRLLWRGSGLAEPLSL